MYQTVRADTRKGTTGMEMGKRVNHMNCNHLHLVYLIQEWNTSNWN